MSVHLTGEINSHTNWKNAPKLYDGNKLATKSFAHGYKSGCRGYGGHRPGRLLEDPCRHRVTPP
jgi:hypothetical protein